MDFPLPELGEGVYEAELVRWSVHPGETVKRGQPLLEVMTDKATMEVPSPFAGTVAALTAEAGTQLKVGDVILTYDAAEAASAVAAVSQATGQAAPKESKQAPAGQAPASRQNGAGVPVKAA